MALVTMLSLISFSTSDIPKVEIPGLDKLAHFMFYSVATILGCFYARERTKGMKSLKLVTIVFALVTIIYGTIIEVLQHMMKGERDGNVFDGMANISGTLVGVCCVLWLFSEKGPLQWKIKS